MFFKVRVRKILVSIIGLALLAGSLMMPVAAKAEDSDPVPKGYEWDVMIYGPPSAPEDAGKFYVKSKDGSIPSKSIYQSIDLPAYTWIMVQCSTVFGSNEDKVKPYIVGEEANYSENQYFNKFSCPVRAVWEADKAIHFYPLPNPSEEKAEPTDIHTHSWTYGTICSPTENSDGLEGEYCSCGAQRNTSVIPAIDVIVQNRYQQIDAARPGVVTILEMKNNCNFSQAFMKRIAAKSDCSFILRFTYEHKNYEAYIPAGTTFDTSFEWYGPKKIMELFEYKQLN